VPNSAGRSAMWCAIGACILALQMGAALAGYVPEPASVVISRKAVDAAVSQEQSRQTLDLINRARSQQGLQPLQWDDLLAEAARAHAEALVDQHRLSHQLPGELPLDRRLAAANVQFDQAGENVAVNYTASGAHQAFMGSTPHRANILDPDFDSVGIAVVRDGDWFYFVQDFARHRARLANATAVRVFSERIAELRERIGQPPLQQTYDERLQDWACAAARTDRLSRPGGVTLSDAQLAVAFSTASPDSLPPDLERLVTQSAASYAVGACFGRTRRYPAGRYFVTLAFFSHPS